MNLVNAIQDLKMKARMYHQYPKWKKRQALWDILEAIEKLEEPEIIYVDETPESELGWDMITGRSKELEKN